jgi:hypothetical protein
MTRVCLYLRISTDEGHQPTSLGTQRERLERYCQVLEDWHIVHAFEDQASGVSLDRPASSTRSVSPASGASTCCSSTGSTVSAAKCASSPGWPKSSTGSKSS